MSAAKKKRPKVVLFGEGDLAATCLSHLKESEELELALLVTVPANTDKSYVGTKELHKAAKEHSVETVLFSKGSREKIVAQVEQIDPALIVFTDFYRAFAGDLFPERKDCFRLHCSLLPKLRGADPLRRALDNGDKVLGATLIECVAEPYEGPIVGQRELQTDGEEKYGFICDDVHEMAAELLIEVGTKLASGKRVKRAPQSEKGVTKAGRMTEQHRRVPWVRGADQVYNRMRAFAPHPGLVTLVELKPAIIEGGSPMTWEAAPFGLPGTFLGIRQGRIVVLCGQNSVFGISRIGWEGEEAMGAAEFMSKERLSMGSRFV
jgi:methionyl-tRNA formyltransferase